MKKGELAIFRRKLRHLPTASSIRDSVKFKGSHNCKFGDRNIPNNRILRDWQQDLEFIDSDVDLESSPSKLTTKKELRIYQKYHQYTYLVDVVEIIFRHIKPPCIFFTERKENDGELMSSTYNSKWVALPIIAKTLYYRIYVCSYHFSLLFWARLRLQPDRWDNTTQLL